MGSAWTGIAFRLLVSIAAATLVVSACANDDPDETATDQTSTTSTTSPTSTAAETSSTTEATESTTTTEPPTTVATDEAICSATGVERPGPQPELPAAVAGTRDAILTAALACDIDGLAALTGSSFTASFGGGDPAEIWTAGENEFSTEPMRALVEILRLAPNAGDESSFGPFYVWPPAFVYETWDDVPVADREALRVLYDETDFDGFAQFGGYVGYRTTIAEDGTWMAFVAGD